MAAFGKDAQKYVEVARAQMSDKDSLGTGAAQIVGAAGNEADLGRAEMLMRQRLASIPAERTLTIDERDRLYELAYTFANADPRASSHIGPLRELMKRKDMTGGFFGMLEVDPEELCDVMRVVVGVKDMGDYQYCFDINYSYSELDFAK